MLALLSLLLSAPAVAADPPVGAISGSKVKTDWAREWRWSLGARGGLVVPMFQSGRGWTLAADKGLVTELAVGTKGLSWVSYGDHSRHGLERGETYLSDLPEASGSALGGTATHWWFQSGLRWEPALPANPGLQVAPTVGGLVGCDFHVTDLEVPIPGGRDRIRTTGYQPSIAPTFGVNFKIHPNLHLVLGTAFGVLFAFDQAEVQGSDRVAVTSRLNTTLEVLGRF